MFLSCMCSKINNAKSNFVSVAGCESSLCCSKSPFNVKFKTSWSVPIGIGSFNFSLQRERRKGHSTVSSPSLHRRTGSWRSWRDRLPWQLCYCLLSKQYLNHCCFAIKQVYDNENPWSISSHLSWPVTSTQPSAALPDVETHVASCRVRVPQKGRANCRDPTLNRTSQSWKNKPDT